MGPITKFNWYDNSAVATASTTPEVTNAPLFLTAFTADKGTERMIHISGDDFYRMYGGSLSFDRHGQVLIQAGKIIDAGGTLLCKRIVADDALLSNIILTIQLTKVTKQDRDADTGAPLYIDASTGDTTTSPGTGEVDNEPYTVTNTIIKWLADQTVTNCKTPEEVLEVAPTLYSAYDNVTPADYNASLPEDERDTLITEVKQGTFPLYAVTDIGRNSNVKSIRIVPKYQVSKRLGFMVYTMSEIEGTTVNENVTVTANPYRVFNNKSYAIVDYCMGELRTFQIEKMFDRYIVALSEATGISVGELIDLDVFFGCDIKGAALTNVSVDASGNDISGDYGIKLASGSDGTGFLYNGTTEYYKSAAYEAMLNKFFSGEIVSWDEAQGPQIYNLDVNKICACVDANYPISVKNTITALANFREDFFFFRDLTLNVKTYTDITTIQSLLTKSRYAADYLTTYDIIDPFTQKRINVTMLYDIVTPLVRHFVNSPYSPPAGIINGFTLDSAIRDSINFIPVTSPEFDQIGLLDDIRVNYATYHEYGGDLTVVALYTSQNAYTQLSWINNVVAIQEVMRAIRTMAPRHRYKLQSGRDFSDYRDACNEILRDFQDWFYTLNFEYLQDDIEADNKIFHAAIEFAFNNWVESEIFDLYAIPISEITT